MNYKEKQSNEVKHYAEKINKNSENYILLNVSPHHQDVDRLILEVGPRILLLGISVRKLNDFLRQIEPKELLNTTIIEKILSAILFNKPFDLTDLEEFYKFKLRIKRLQKSFRPLLSDIVRSMEIPYEVEMFLLGFGWEKQARLDHIELSVVYGYSIDIIEKFGLLSDSYGLEQPALEQFRKEMLDSFEYYITTGEFYKETEKVK